MGVRRRRRRLRYCTSDSRTAPARARARACSAASRRRATSWNGRASLERGQAGAEPRHISSGRARTEGRWPPVDVDAGRCAPPTRRPDASAARTKLGDVDAVQTACRSGRRDLRSASISAISASGSDSARTSCPRIRGVRAAWCSHPERATRRRRRGIALSATTRTRVTARSDTTFNAPREHSDRSHARDRRTTGVPRGRIARVRDHALASSVPLRPHRRADIGQVHATSPTRGTGTTRSCAVSTTCA